MNLDNLEHNTRDGLHIAALAGAWTALVIGFGGLRDAEGILHFTLRPGETVTRPVRPASADQPPVQPPGRAPARRG